MRPTILEGRADRIFYALAYGRISTQVPLLSERVLWQTITGPLFDERVHTVSYMKFGFRYLLRGTLIFEVLFEVKERTDQEHWPVAKLSFRERPESEMIVHCTPSPGGWRIWPALETPEPAPVPVTVS